MPYKLLETVSIFSFHMFQMRLLPIYCQRVPQISLASLTSQYPGRACSQAAGKGLHGRNWSVNLARQRQNNKASSSSRWPIFNFNSSSLNFLVYVQNWRHYILQIWICRLHQPPPTFPSPIDPTPPALTTLQHDYVNYISGLRTD